jgi:hypothetical protein
MVVNHVTDGMCDDCVTCEFVYAIAGAILACGVILLFGYALWDMTKGLLTGS